jgi:hypothetical protein
MLVASTTGTATSTAFVIDPNGKVGIGTTSPYTQLGVSGGVAADYFTSNSTSATSTFAGGFGIGTTSPFGTVSIEQGTEANSFWVGNNGSSSPSFTIGGTDRGGRIGIGTASPLAQVHIVSPGASITALAIENPGTDVTMQLRKAGTIKGEFGINSGDQIYLRRSNSGTAPFIINTSDQALFTVGNVGIGTTSPYGKLTINSVAANVPTILAYGYSNQTSPLLFIASTTGSATSTAFIIDSNGKVGIGTSTPYTQLGVSGGVAADFINANSPTASSTIAGFLGIGVVKPFTRLHVANSQSGRNTIGDARVMMLENTNGATNELQEIGFGYAFNAQYQPVVIGHKVTDGTGSTKGSFYIATRDSGTSSINPTERLTIDSAGRMGLGTSTPFATFSLSANASDAYNPNIFVIASSTSGTATTSLLTLQSGGNLGVGTSSPWRTLSVAGSLAASGLSAGSAGDFAVCINNVTKELTNAGASGCIVSSRRFKDNINPLTSGLDEVMKFNPSSFSLKGQDPSDIHLGFIAEEMQDVDKRLVQYESDGITPRTVRYEEITAVLAKAIQEQQAQISDLKIASIQASTTPAINQTITNNILTTSGGLTVEEVTGIASSTAYQVVSQYISSNNIFTNLASSTADILASSSPSFVLRIAIAVKESIHSAGDWAVAKISASLAIFDRVETKTLCVGNTCVTEDQLKDLLAKANANTTNTSNQTNTNNNVSNTTNTIINTTTSTSTNTVSTTTTPITTSTSTDNISTSTTPIVTSTSTPVIETGAQPAPITIVEPTTVTPVDQSSVNTQTSPTVTETGTVVNQ